MGLQSGFSKQGDYTHFCVPGHAKCKKRARVVHFRVNSLLILGTVYGQVGLHPNTVPAGANELEHYFCLAPALLLIEGALFHITVNVFFL
jgi:hypothetical protein